jgi:biotin-(acetyl-CoA carboxylase) ligase
MFASVVVVVFKLLSSMIKRGLMKGLYLLVLILFVAGILTQGKEGGELVYEYGVNVQKVQNLKSELDDLKEELKSLQATEEKTEPALKEPAPKIEKTLGEEVQRVETSKAKPTIEKKPEVLQEEVVEEVKDSAVEKVDIAKEKTTAISEPKEAVEQKRE